MKRLDIIIKSDKLDSVVDSIKKIGVGGLTITPSQGQGSTEPALAGKYFSRQTIMVIVEDDKVNDILTAVSDVAYTGHRGDGKIFISNVEEVMDLCTKECGYSVL